MYQVALCDDEQKELNKTEVMLSDYRREHPELDFAIDCFESAEELLRKAKEENYVPNLLLMDIYMPGKMGIEVIRELRDMGNEGRVIFLTTSKEHALEAFDVAATQYLLKPVSKDVLFPVLDSIFKEVGEEARRYLLLKADSCLRRVALRDIVFCEAQKKVQNLYLTNGARLQLHMTMAEIWGMLSSYQEFVKVGVAYIVNLKQVESLNAKEISMNIGKKIYLPRGAYKSLRKQYFDYYTEV